MSLRKISPLIFLVIFSLCLLAYHNSLHNPFIWDDDALIVKGPLIKGFRNLPKVFTNDLFFGASSGSNFYRPMQALSLMLDHHFWRLDPFGYHLTNIILQGFVSFLVFLFVYSLFRKISVSFCAALFFCLSPLATESVTYISGRAELLLGAFLLSSFLLFIKALDKDKPYKPVVIFASLFCFALGLLSKELAIVFPLVLSVYLFYRREKSLDRRELLALLPFYIITLFYILLRFTVLNFKTLRPAELTRIPFLIRISALPQVLFTYIKLLILPVDLHMSRSLVRPADPLGASLLWFLLFALVAGCLYLLFFKKNKGIFSFLLFWFLIFLFPQSGILPINAFVSEHFIYLSSISFFAGLAYLLNKYLRKELFAAACLGIAFYYGSLTHARNFDWQDPIAFYKNIIKFSPESFQAYNNLGVQYEYRHQYDEAIRHYRRALDLRPELLEAHSNLANIYFKTKRLDEAKNEYEIVQKSAPGEKAGEIQNNIGAVFELEGNVEKALEKYHLALKLDPGLYFARFNIARIYFSKGDIALCSKETLLSLPEVRVTGAALNAHLRIIEELLKKIKNMNSAPAVYNDLGIAFAEADYLSAAIVSFRRALELEPRYVDAHFNLGLAYWKNRDKKQAVFEFKACLKIQPSYEKARMFLLKIVNKR